MNRHELADLSVHELVSRLCHALWGNEQLRRAIARDICGVTLAPTTSCQLPREHEGMHVWASPDGGQLIRW